MKSIIKIQIFYLAMLATTTPVLQHLCAQGLNVIKKPESYQQEINVDSSRQMLEIKTVIPDIVYDLRYATKNNFTKKRLYKKIDQTYLRKPAVYALYDVEKELNSIGYGLKIFDAYRPYSVTEKIWDLVGDERFAADPKKGSNHNRGIAVDLTLIDLSTKKELDMGTGFDSFTDTAHTSFIQLPKQVLRNRFLLKEIMIKHGFNIFETEWWHFSWPNNKDYSVLDLSFKELAKLAN